MSNKKAVCRVCGAEYDLCAFCPDTEKFTPWRRLCDTAEHYKLFVLISEYNGGVLTKEEAYERLQNIKFDDAERKTFSEAITKGLNEIESVKSKKTSKSKFVAKTVKEIEDVEEAQTSEMEAETEEVEEDIIL